LCQEEGSSATRPPPQHVAFLVRTPAPQQQQQQEQPQQPSTLPQPPPQQQQHPHQQQEAASGTQTAGAPCSRVQRTHMSLVLLYNVKAVGHTAQAQRTRDRPLLQHPGRALLLHIDPHSRRYIGSCCSRVGPKCAAEFPGGPAGLHHANPTEQKAVVLQRCAVTALFPASSS
jgi:hypothetical protein